MDAIEELSLIHWKRVIGKLPDGFFLTVEDHLLWLNFNGPGFEIVIEPGGSRPSGNHAHICSFDITGHSESKNIKDTTETAIIRVQKEVSGVASYAP